MSNVRQVTRAVNGGSEASNRWKDQFKHRTNQCKNCMKTCNFCLENGEAEKDIKYPKPLNEKEKETTNTWMRWLIDYWEDIEAFVENNFHDEDWRWQKRWMAEHRRIAFSMLNDHELPNRVRIAKTLKELIEAEYGITIMIGRPDSGKSWTFLWLAEAMHNHDPEKPIYYIGDESMKVPDWMNIISSYGQAENDSWICLDEASARAKARNAMSNVNQWLTTQATRVAHKDVHLFFISQHPNIIDKNLRRLALSFIIKPISFHEDASNFWRMLEPYIPDIKQRTGFFSTKFNTAYEFFQPAPLSPERKNFTKMFRDEDVTMKGGDLFETEDEEEEEKEKEVKLKPLHIKIYKFVREEDHTNREAADKFDVSLGTVSYALKKYEENVGEEDEED